MKSPENQAQLPQSYWLFLSAKLISFSGSVMAPLALALALLERDGSAGDFAIVLALNFLGQIVFTVLGGIFGDRYGIRSNLVAGNVVAGTTQLAAAALLSIDGNVLPWLSAISFISGSAGAFISPSSSAAIARLVRDPSQVRRATSLHRMCTHVIRTVGPILATLLVALVGSTWVLLWDAASFLMAAIVFGALRVHSEPAVETTGLALLSEGWREFVRLRWLLLTVVQFSVVSMAWVAGFQVAIPALLTATGRQTSWGVLLSSFSLGLLAGSLFMLRIRPNRPLVLGAAATILSTAPFFSMAVTESLPVNTLMFAISGCATEIFAVSWAVTMSTKIALNQQARMFSFDFLGGMVLTPLGIVLTPIMLHIFPFSVLLLGCAGLIVLATLLACGSASVRDLRLNEPAATHL